jgi:hypothetical protein
MLVRLQKAVFPITVTISNKLSLDVILQSRRGRQMTSPVKDTETSNTSATKAVDEKGSMTKKDRPERAQDISTHANAKKATLLYLRPLTAVAGAREGANS